MSLRKQKQCMRGSVGAVSAVYWPWFGLCHLWQGAVIPGACQSKSAKMGVTIAGLRTIQCDSSALKVEGST